jgi:hypothetical protein
VSTATSCNVYYLTAPNITVDTLVCTFAAPGGCADIAVGADNSVYIVKNVGPLGAGSQPGGICRLNTATCDCPLVVTQPGLVGLTMGVQENILYASDVSGNVIAYNIGNPSDVYVQGQIPTGGNGAGDLTFGGTPPKLYYVQGPNGVVYEVGLDAAGTPTTATKVAQNGVPSVLSGQQQLVGAYCLNSVPYGIAGATDTTSVGVVTWPGTPDGSTGVPVLTEVGTAVLSVISGGEASGAATQPVCP